MDSNHPPRTTARLPVARLPESPPSRTDYPDHPASARTPDYPTHPNPPQHGAIRTDYPPHSGTVPACPAQLRLLMPRTTLPARTDSPSHRIAQRPDARRLPVTPRCAPWHRDPSPATRRIARPASSPHPYRQSVAARATRSTPDPADKPALAAPTRTAPYRLPGPALRTPGHTTPGLTGFPRPRASTPPTRP